MANAPKSGVSGGIDITPPEGELSGAGALALAAGVEKASMGVVDGNGTSNIILAGLILEPKTMKEVLSNIRILHETDYSDNLIPFVIATFKKLDIYFKKGMALGTSSELFNYFKKHKEELKMLSEIYNDKYVEIFTDSQFSIELCFDFEQILQPNYFDNQEQSRIESINIRALRKELELLVGLTSEVLGEYLEKPGMLDELYAKMLEDGKLNDRELERISSFLSGNGYLIYKEALFYMLCIEFRAKELTRRVQEGKMNSDEQKSIMEISPTTAVGILYDLIKNEKTNS